ncbi:ATP-dependent DNA helicase PIF1-like [Rhizophagus irregularis DAOM 181602=DAOM 197198]|uniref:Uncharacterized protein n=1 Tax=Rhizophagus irregularis (strain DAOM 197198w) TaxID=1432141 RepID=A0A015INT6_RHIIW|nr:hypothetical protein RirG_193880 [Rhizophagus irregularis DAOM 197198w]GET49989.1 ATP-dependent DNA helicase PIF1-like [Rhizophagus irregularis DAOM 181602=DAOM 197198]
MSMVGRRFLAIIDLRLWQTFPDHYNIPFGSRSIILVGDYGQLPPACDVPGLSRSYGRSAYSQLQEICKIEAMQRQQVTRINNNNSDITYVMEGLHDPTGNY